MTSTEKTAELAKSKDIINKVIITGHVGKDPTLDTVGSNYTLSKFSVATNDFVGGEGKTSTLWHNIIAWGKLAEAAHESLKRGNRVTLEGRINYKQYVDKSGVKKTFTEIILTDFVNHSKREAA